MAPHVLRGRGAFRCGCGAGVRVDRDSRIKTEVCALADCNIVAYRTRVISLCKEHYRKLLLATLPDTYEKYPVGEWIAACREYREEFGVDLTPPEWVQRQEAVTGALLLNQRHLRSHEPVVYFAMLGNQVKIGTTANISERFEGSMLPPTVEIWVIPGSYEQERSYHRRFAVERIRRTEWFNLSDRLRGHIDDMVQSGEAKCRDSVTPRWKRS